jgi:hypothetical protein
MSKHNDIYNILGKLTALTPTQTPAKESILKTLNESAPADATTTLSKRYMSFKERLAESNGVDEEVLTKPDFLDMDKDGDKKEPMKKAAADKKAGPKKGVNPFAKKEEVEELDELDKKTLSSYVEKATTSRNKMWKDMPKNKTSGYPEKTMSKVMNRNDSIRKAQDKLTKEEVEEGVYDAAPKKVDIPAYQRKANGGDWKVTQKDLDADDEKNMSSKAGLAKLKRDLDMTEDQVNEYESDSQGRYVHKGTKGYGNDPVDFDDEDEMDAPASKGGIPRKRGRPAKAKAPERVTAKAWKHKDGRKVAEDQVNEYETDSKGRYVHKGTYGGTATDDGSEDDYDEWGNKKAVAKKATSDEPKKRGRPAKAKGPERVTSKAWKHKDGRVKESVKLDTFVEDTLAEMDALIVNEKAVSKAQQKFMGMVHATQKGEKAPSKEVAKVAKDMDKKDAKDFASTKHKGLPKHVKESRETLVENTLQAIVRKFGKEVRDFAQGGDLDNDLFDALYDYYFDDMPYGVKKARDGDPYEWITQRFDDAINHGDIEVTESNVAERNEVMVLEPDAELNELARLAGLGSPAVESKCNHTMEGEMCPEHGLAECGGMYESAKPDYIDIDKDGDKEESMKDAVKDKDEDDELDEASHFIKGVKRFIKGKDNPSDVRDRHLAKMANAPGDVSVQDKEGKRFDKVQGVIDKVGMNENELEECGDMGPMDNTESGISINASFDSKTGRKTLNVTADGDSANQLAQVLKMAGLTGHSHEHVPSASGSSDLANMLRRIDGADVANEMEVDEEFVNEPNEQYADVDTINDQGNDLNRKKQQYADKPKMGDNPMATEEVALESRLAELYNSLKVVKK